MNTIRVGVLAIALCVAVPAAMTRRRPRLRRRRPRPIRRGMRCGNASGPCSSLEGPKIGVEFRQSSKQPYNFVGSLSRG